MNFLLFQLNFFSNVCYDFSYAKLTEQHFVCPIVDFMLLVTESCVVLNFTKLNQLTKKRKIISNILIKITATKLIEINLFSLSR